MELYFLGVAVAIGFVTQAFKGDEWLSGWKGGFRGFVLVMCWPFLAGFLLAVALFEEEVDEEEENGGGEGDD